MSPDPVKNNPAPRKRLPATTPQWHVHPTTDHAGRRAHTVWLRNPTTTTTSSSSSSSMPPPPPPPPPPQPATSLQIYSATPIPNDDPAAAWEAVVSIARLVIGGGSADLLSQLRNEAGAPPRFDVYDAPPPQGSKADDVDMLACVRHQKREIAARRGTPSSIPRFGAAAGERARGLLVVVVVAGKKEGGRRTGEELEGPLLVWFQRGGRERSVRVPWDLEVEMGGELALERTEVLAVRVRSWGALGSEMGKVWVQSGEERDGKDWAWVEKIKGEAGGVSKAEADNQESAIAAAPPQIQSYFKDDSAGNSPSNSPGDSASESTGDSAGDFARNHALVVHNMTTTASLSNAELHYLVYDLTGSTADDNALITLARSFISDLLIHLSPDTTVVLEFHRAPTLATSIQHFRGEQAARPDLSVGYLPHAARKPRHHHRIFPCSPHIEAGIDRHRASSIGAGKQSPGFNTFLVAVETSSWEKEDSVLLVRADSDLKASRQLTGQAPDDENAVVGNAVELLVGRPPGMNAVAERLAGIS
ncbi:uncharacterized protein LTHEOB_4564 [Lasiodiplodia theobromae]|uniref:uncharacterized protein n=1 Tax=Lasiodiplodia theobromae TaxID=45133 RepID=UPI0015C31C63|nr:uncharacterized protein LTHEOB_4564 [Lasiodiplodia theobromae]KAF4545912.1 hypothetical protein LTHEOB_4564 [Lasiodiplodia theobromae]